MDNGRMALFEVGRGFFPLFFFFFFTAGTIADAAGNLVARLDAEENCWWRQHVSGAASAHLRFVGCEDCWDVPATGPTLARLAQERSHPDKRVTNVDFFRPFVGSDSHDPRDAEECSESFSVRRHFRAVPFSGRSCGSASPLRSISVSASRVGCSSPRCCASAARFHGIVSG